MRRILPLLLAGLPLLATTLEKLTIEQMSQKATAIVRARIGSCRSNFRGSTIYTTCSISVTERWKGGPVSEVSTPGGTVQGLSQSFSGSPVLAPGQEYVLFLWAGRSGFTQVIGLSQGVFDIGVTSKGEVAHRDATDASLLDSTGKEVEDSAVELKVQELRRKVAAALGAEK